MKTDSRGVIPSGLVFRGTIEGEGDLEVAGRVEGTIQLQGDLLLDRGASIAAEVRVRRALIRGEVMGDIHATEAIDLAASARVEGELKGPQLVIAPGAAVRGRVELGGGDVDAAIGAGTAGGAAPAATDGSGVPTEATVAPREKPALPDSALAFGDRRKQIVSKREEMA